MVRPDLWMLLCCLLLGVVGCSGAKEAGSGTTPTATNGSNPGETPPTCEPPMENPPVAVSPFIHHTPGDVVLVMARPARAMNNPIVTGMIKEIEAADPSVKVADEFKKIEDELGIDPKQVEYVVVSVSSKTLAVVAPKPRPQSDFRVRPPERSIQALPEEPEPAPHSAVPSTEAAPLDEKSKAPCGHELADEPASTEPAAATHSDHAHSPDDHVHPPGDHAHSPDDHGDHVHLPGDHGMPPEGFDGFELPPSPAVLVKLLTPIDGDVLIAKMESKDKAKVEKMFGNSESNFVGLDKETLAVMKKQQDDFRQSMLKESEIHRSEHKGVTLYQKGKAKDRFCLLNQQTVLFAPEAAVKAAIDRKGAAEASPLSAQLQTFVDRDFAVAIDLAPVDAMSKSGQLELPFPVMLFAAPLLKCRILSLAADINGGNLLQVNLVAANESGAKQLHGMLNPLLKDGIAKARAAKDGPGLPAEASPFLPLGEKMLDGIKLTQTGDLLSLVVARPAGLEDLPTLARPMLVEAAERKREVAKRNDLKQIGLGMHNFHDSYTHLPAHDRGGSEAVGLSWRVHILPYLNESPLYNEFHMDEPWDSEHNKALIPRMPKVYGTSAEGKTSMHVFVGEGTPLGGKPIGFRDVTDGLSNTLVVVRAGDDTADIWTKPGGLTFDKANPIAALGNIADKFDVLIMDGSAKSLPKTIDATILGNLIIYNDGNPIEIP